MKTLVVVLFLGVALASGMTLGSSATLAWLHEAYRWVSNRLDSRMLSALALAGNLILLTVLVSVGLRTPRPEDPETRRT